MVRWKAVIPIVIIAAVIMLGAILFLDNILKSRIVKAGQAIFGAKVEVQSVRFTFKDFLLDIKGLTVADRNDPWSNLFEIGEVRGKLTPSQLLYKKVIIDELAVEGVTWGGPRKTSGALPRVREPKKDGTKPGLIEKYAKSITLPDLKTLEQSLDAKKLVSADQLAAVRKIAEFKTTFTAQSEAWKKDAGELKAQADEVERIADRLKTLPDLKVRSLADIQQVTTAIHDLNTAKRTLENMQKDVRSKKEALNQDLGSYQGYLKELDALRETDYRDILARVNLDSLDVRNISEAVFGPVLVSQADTIQRYVGLLRRYMPVRNKNDLRTEFRPVRVKGVDVRFPLKRAYPEFLIEKVSVSGNRDALAFSGVVTGITSNPALYGKPTMLMIKGGRGGEVVSLSGVIDHTRDTIDDTFELTFRGIDLSGKRVSSGKYLQHEIARGKEDIATRIVFQDKDWEVKFLVKAFDLNLSRKEQANDRAQQLIDEVLSIVDTVTVEAMVAEVNGETTFSCKSNIDELMVNKIKALFGKKLDEARAKIRKELDAVVDAKKQELIAMITEQKNALLPQYDAQDNFVKDNLSLVNGKITEGQGNIKAAGKQEVDKQKQGLQKKGTDELKKLFR